MYIVDVIPITRTIGTEMLTYFTATPLDAGTIVTIPLRKKTVPGLVVRTHDIEEVKSSVRRGDFALRKITAAGSHRIFTKQFLAAVETTATLSGTSIGAILATAVPSHILTGKSILPEAPAPATRIAARVVAGAIAAPLEHRLFSYKNVIDRTLSRGLSVYVCAPTRHAAEELHAALSYDHAFLLHGGITPKRIEKTWHGAVTAARPILMVGTGQILSVPRNDIGLIIVESEAAHAFKSQRRPFMDFRILAEAFAEMTGAEFILGDSVLRVETRWRLKRGELLSVTPRNIAKTAEAEVSVADMRSPTFTAMGEQAIHAIRTGLARNGTIFVFAARRGVAPTTICQDCGETVACTQCSAPVVLHRTKPRNSFLCHRCGSERDAAELCRNCGSWKLKTLGIGSEFAEEAVRELFPNATVIRIDADSELKPSDIRKTIEEHSGEKGLIVVGTERALPYIKTVDTSIVISLDSLLAVPDFHMGERIVTLLADLREKTEHSLVIQTRKPDDSMINALVGNNIEAFYENELSDREQFSLPPFFTLIKVSITGSKELATAGIQEFEERFARFHPITFPAALERNNTWRKSSIMKLPRASWPDPELLRKLSMLPPQFEVDVNPQSML